MPTPADTLARLLAAVLAYRPQPWAWPRPRPAYLSPAAGRPGWGGVRCGFIENGARKGFRFPTATDAPRRLPAPNGGRPGAGYLRCPASVTIATP